MPNAIQNISTLAMLTHISFSHFTGNKTDRSVTQSVTHDCGAKDGIARVSKYIIPKEGLKEITEVIHKTRTYHHMVTLPWGENTRILPATKFTEYSAKIRVFKQEFHEAVIRFIREYEDLKTEAKVNLGTLYNESDYPSDEELLKKFNFKHEIFPVPNANDFRVDLSDEAVAVIKQEIEVSTNKMVLNATQSVWSKLLDVVEKVNERLSREEAVFRNSLISNLMELVDLLPDLNITRDANLEAMRVEIKYALLAYTPDEIRKNPEIRKELAESSAEILERMKGYCSM